MRGADGAVRPSGGWTLRCVLRSSVHAGFLLTLSCLCGRVPALPLSWPLAVPQCRISREGLDSARLYAEEHRGEPFLRQHG